MWLFLFYFSIFHIYYDDARVNGRESHEEKTFQAAGSPCFSSALQFPSGRSPYNAKPGFYLKRKHLSE